VSIRWAHRRRHTHGGRRGGVLRKDFGPDGKRRPDKDSSRAKQDIIQEPKNKSEEIDKNAWKPTVVAKVSWPITLTYQGFLLPQQRHVAR
jgi:hypothetical protein